jgi:hypothetical protein
MEKKRRCRGAISICANGFLISLCLYAYARFSAASLIKRLSPSSLYLTQ